MYRAALMVFACFTVLPLSAQEVNRSSKNLQKAAKRKARQEKISNYIRQQEEAILQGAPPETSP